MARWAAAAVCGIGWVVLVAGGIAPLAGMAWVFVAGDRTPAAMVAIPGAGVLLFRSVTLAVVATVGATVLGLLPAAILGASRGRSAAVLLGLTLAPLLIPPQVYAYAWQLALAPNAMIGRWTAPDLSSRWVAGAVRAGLVAGGWLWPVAALVLAAGWRSTGWTAYKLAMLDTTPARAYLRAVVPSLRPYLTAAACLVFVMTLLEYAIPHLMLCRVHATTLQELFEYGVPHGQIVRLAAQGAAVVIIVVAVAAWSVRGVGEWLAAAGDEEVGAGAALGRRACRPVQQCGRARSALTWLSRVRLPVPVGGPVWAGAAAVWALTVGVPVGVMVASLRVPGAWREGFVLFAREWSSSLLVAVTAAGLSVALSVCLTMWRRARSRRGASVISLPVYLAALAPPAALGVGFLTIFNRPGFAGSLYTETPWIWALALAGRYGAVAVLVAWLVVGRRGIIAAEQARADGAGALDVLAFVLLPMHWPSLLAAGLIVAALSLSEVVVTQMVGPVGFPSIAVTLLGQMHYGRDDVVITMSLVVVGAGVLVTQLCGWLLARRER